LHVPSCQKPGQRALGKDIDLLPFAGVARMLFDGITGARAWAPKPLADPIKRFIVLATSLGLAGFACLVAACLPAVLRGASPLRPLGAAWLLLAATIALLRAGGPWVEPAGYLRATTKFHVVGCLVFGAGGPILVFGRRVRLAVLTVAGLAMVGCGWVYCTSQIGLRVLAGLPP
jgi:hypothetical protein